MRHSASVEIRVVFELHRHRDEFSVLHCRKELYLFGSLDRSFCQTEAKTRSCANVVDVVGGGIDYFRITVTAHAFCLASSAYIGCGFIARRTFRSTSRPTYSLCGVLASPGSA